MHQGSAAGKTGLGAHSNMKKRIAFITLGSFSHTNDKVRDLLAERFPDHALDSLDIHRTELFGIAHRLSQALAAFRYYPVKRLSRENLGWAMMRTPVFLKQARELVARRLGTTRYAFTFQTQSLFDASRHGTAHFVYTDHTHLASLSYPAFDKAKLANKHWIDGEGDIYRNATAVLTMSSNISASLIEHYRCPADKVHCVFVGSNTEFPSNNALSSQRFSRKTILFVGIDWERKGGPELVEAFRAVLPRHAGARLVIVGCSPQVDLPAGSCEVVGRIPLSKVSDYYKEASIFCLPTNLEPFGIVFLEAFAHGLPVVATRIGAIPDFVVDGETGLLVTPGNHDELVTQLDRLLADPSLCERMGKNGRRLALERYSWECTGGRIAATIRQYVSP